MLSHVPVLQEIATCLLVRKLRLITAVGSVDVLDQNAAKAGTDDNSAVPLALVLQLAGRSFRCPRVALLALLLL